MQVTVSSPVFTSLAWDQPVGHGLDPVTFLRRLVSMGSWEQLQAVQHLTIPSLSLRDEPRLWHTLTRRQGALLAWILGCSRVDAVERMEWCQGDPPVSGDG